MIVAEPWWVFPRVIQPRECDRIIELGLAKERERGTGRDLPLEHERRTDVAWIGEDWVYDLVEPWALKANESAGWRFDLTRMQSLQFGVYPVGGHYDWHFDIRGRPYGPKDNVHDVFHGMMRKLSFSVQLSDPASYDGGDLEIELGLPSEAVRIEAPDPERLRGTAIVFPSFLPHRVTPVTRGVRYSLVGWYCGPPWR